MLDLNCYNYSNGTNITWYSDCESWIDSYHVRELLGRHISASEYNMAVKSNGNDTTATITEGEKKMVIENETQKIKKVIFSDPATIVLWEDGTKTVVKIQKGDRYDPEKGLAMACMRKILSKKDYHRLLEGAKKAMDDAKDVDVLIRSALDYDPTPQSR